MTVGQSERSGMREGDINVVENKKPLLSRERKERLL